MPSHETDTSSSDEIADDALIGAPAPASAPRRRPWWLWGGLGLVVGVPLLLTLIGALTSPPHVKGIPAGTLVYLEADAPSEHTTTLRGLYAVTPGTPPRLLVHETEPQDSDGGVREWITQPALSPDGRWVAYEKQLISLQEEKQSIVSQLWVQPIDLSAPAHLLLDFTAQKMKQPVGLAWDSDSSVLILEDGTAYSVPTQTLDTPLKMPLDLHGLTLSPTPALSATRSPSLTEAGGFAYSVQTPTGPQILIQTAGKAAPGPAASVFALSPTGGVLAYVPPGTNVLRLSNPATGATLKDIPARWGWSVFGKRAVTSLRWSPDGQSLAYTVSKPPVPDDEIFIVSVDTGKTVQLPYRTGLAAWDWGK